MEKDFDLGWRIPIPANDSATLRISTNIQKISILSALNEVLKERRSLEHRRNSLLQSAAFRQHQVQETKNKCDAGWQEKIQEAQQIGEKYESECANLRERRDHLHRQLMIKIDKSTPHKILHNIPGLRANYKIQACQLQRDIADLKRRVNNAMFRLEAEKKIANSLSNTVKELRIEAGTKKFNSMSIRPRTLAILSHPPQCRSSRENIRSRNTPRFTTSVGSWSRAFQPGCFLAHQNNADSFKQSKRRQLVKKTKATGAVQILGNSSSTSGQWYQKDSCASYRSCRASFYNQTDADLPSPVCL